MRKLSLPYGRDKAELLTCRDLCQLNRSVTIMEVKNCYSENTLYNFCTHLGALSSLFIVHSVEILRYACMHYLSGFQTESRHEISNVGGF